MRHLNVCNPDGSMKKFNNCPPQFVTFLKENGYTSTRRRALEIDGDCRYVYDRVYNSTLSWINHSSLFREYMVWQKKKSQTLILSDSLKDLINKNFNNKVFRILSKWSYFAKTKEGNYFTIRKNEKISYHPRPDRQQFSENGDWKRDGRQEIKLAALLKMLYGPAVLKFITNADIEEATNIIKGYGQNPKPEISTFEEMYNISTYSWQQSSCMSGKGYIELYENNPKVFKPIVWRKVNGEICGRCLLVTVDKFTYYDRIYYKASEDYLAIIEAIKEENLYHWKTYNGIGENYFSGPDQHAGKQIDVYANINFDDSWNVPYMDTLKFYETDSGDLQNFEPDGNHYILNNTDGTYTDRTIDYVTDFLTGDEIPQDEAEEIEFGDGRGEWTHRSNVYWSNHNNGYILR